MYSKESLRYSHANYIIANIFDRFNANNRAIDCWPFKDALSGLRPLLATESPLKIMKNAFNFTLKALFFLKIYNFLLWLFGHLEKLLD